jgi:hypothetical protein
MQCRAAHWYWKLYRDAVSVPESSAGELRSSLVSFGASLVVNLLLPLGSQISKDQLSG